MNQIKLDEGALPRSLLPVPPFDSSVFERAEVGQSFLLPPGTIKPSTLNYYAWLYGRRLGRKFSVRKTPTGYRCWRVA